MGMVHGADRPEKKCRACPTVFRPTGNSQPFCTDCQAARTAFKHKLLRDRKRAAQGLEVRPGSGGKPGGVTEQNYRRFFLMDLFRKQDDGQCYGCGDYFPPEKLLMHHKDHNRKNNRFDNFELLCKRCHQVEHECWLAFQKV